MKRSCISVSLSAALILAAPGPFAATALAQVVSPRSGAVPVLTTAFVSAGLAPAAPCAAMTIVLPLPLFSSSAGLEFPAGTPATAALAAPAQSAPTAVPPAPQGPSVSALLHGTAPRLQEAAAQPATDAAEWELRAVYDQAGRGAAREDEVIPPDSLDPRGGSRGLSPNSLAPRGGARGQAVPTVVDAYNIAYRERALYLAPYVRRYAAPALAGIAAIAALVAAPAGIVPAAAAAGALILSVLLHESAHLWALRRYGDRTPEKAGRRSLNPIHHIDPLWTVLVPAATLVVSMATIGIPLPFGMAKAVPADFNNLVDRKVETAKVAAAGVGANVILAAASGLALLALGGAGLIAAGGAAHFVLSALFQINGALAAFNLLPLPWLDGGKILVGLAPKSAYARWIYNPALPKGPYQDFFQRIYQGPSNLLTRFGIRRQEQVNGLTTALTFAALAAFYGAAYSVAAVPLLFLMLPCKYDYWCIREKVRSEAAVQQMMQFMGEWGAVMAQIGEDLGARSEASARDVELRMVYAVDSLLETLMDQEEFKKLSDEDKAKELIRQLPGHAVSILKGTPDDPGPFFHDNEDKIRDILADPRNQPYYDRLAEWLKEWEIFEKMASPHAKKELKDAIDETKKDKTRQSGQ